MFVILKKMNRFREFFNSVSHSSSSSIMESEASEIQQSSPPKGAATSNFSVQKNSFTSEHHHNPSLKNTSFPRNELITFGTFRDIPLEVVENHIFPCLDYVWLFQTASLVSLDWKNLSTHIHGTLRMIFEDEDKCSSFLQSCANGRFHSVSSLIIAGN